MVPKIFTDGNSHIFPSKAPKPCFLRWREIASFIKDIVGGKKGLIMKAKELATFDNGSAIGNRSFASLLLQKPWHSNNRCNIFRCGNNFIKALLSLYKERLLQ